MSKLFGNVKGGLAAGLLVGVLASACGGDDDEEDLSQLTPAQLCQRKCEEQAAGQCSPPAPSFVDDCGQLCQAKYQKFPNCTAQARAFDTCAVERMHFSCVNGAFTGSPMGACAAPGAACYTCTGDILNCL